MQIETSELQQLLAVVEEQNISIAEAIERIKGNSNGKAEAQPQPAEEITLTVDYGRTVKQMIKAGKYNGVNSDITEKNFPLPTELIGQKTSVSGKLFHFGKDISSEDVIFEMDKSGYRPATLPELLALGEAHPDLQRQFPIIALGSVWRVAAGSRIVPALAVDGYGRKLHLFWFGPAWYVICRFFGVRK